MTNLCNESGKKLDESSFSRKVKIKCKNCLDGKVKCEVCGKYFTKNGKQLMSIENMRTKLILKSKKNQKLIMLEITITIEHFWSGHFFRVKPILC